MDAALVIKDLNRALCQRQVEPDQLLIQTDQGSQFRAGHYKDLLRKREIVFNIPAKCGGLDNAVVESFFSTLTLELDLEDDRAVSIPHQQLQCNLAFGIEVYSQLQDPSFIDRPLRLD